MIKTFFLLTFLFPFYGYMGFDSLPPNCAETAYKDMTMFGHSRVVYMQGSAFTDYIQNAKINGIRLLDQARLTSYQPLGWGGAIVRTREDFDEPREYGETSPLDYYARIQDCKKQGIPIRTSPKVFINLGGNDMLSFYDKMERREGLYLLYLFLSNPVAAAKAIMTEILSGGKNKSKELEAWWLWNFNSETDRITYYMKEITKYHLDNLPMTGKQNEVILASDPTAFATPNKLFSKGNWTRLLRLGTYFGLLQSKYFKNIYGELVKTYPTRLHFLDLYYRFLHNIIYEGASFYTPTTYSLPFPDGIHFGGSGLEEYGRLLAFKMGSIGWFPWNPSVTQAALERFSNSAEAQEALTLIWKKSTEAGIDPVTIFNSELKNMSNGKNIGFKVDFDKKSGYFKKDLVNNKDNLAFIVQEAIRDKYRKNGDASGHLGFPMSDEECAGIACSFKVSFFEWGCRAFLSAKTVA